MNKTECKVSKSLVEWYLPKENIENILINKKNGLLFKPYESAGKIEFEDTACKVIDNEKVCNKTMTTTLKFRNGNADSVLTPMAVINYHTHPLDCYIEGETIWGWPSGEDLKQCIQFAKGGNVCHIIFAIEGTYIIDINKSVLKYMTEEIEDRIELLFQITHNFRVYSQDSTKFYHNFCKPLGIKDKNLVKCWVSIVNNLTFNSLKKLSQKIIKKDLDILGESEGDSSKIGNTKIYNVQFIKNETPQWNSKYNNKQIYQVLKSKQFSVNYPKNIKYKAPFISKSCKL